VREGFDCAPPICEVADTGLARAWLGHYSAKKKACPKARQKDEAHEVFRPHSHRQRRVWPAPALAVCSMDEGRRAGIPR